MTYQGSRATQCHVPFYTSSNTVARSNCPLKRAVRRVGAHVSSGIRIITFYVSSLRHLDRKHRPLPCLAGRVDPAAVLFGDALGDREAQAGAALLGRKVRLEDLLERFGLDAAAGVGHLDPHAIAVL